MIPVELVGVRVEVPANTPMVLLREQEGRHRLLPIYIGTPEASAIHYALEGIEPPRPFTHDLFLTTVDELGASLDKVVVTDAGDSQRRLGVIGRLCAAAQAGKSMTL